MLHKDQKKVAAGAIIGGVLGLGALAIYYAAKKEKKCSFKIIGDSICQVVETLEGCSLKEGAEKAVHQVEDKIKEHEGVITTCFELASVGISLWKKIKKGM